MPILTMHGKVELWEGDAAVRLPPEIMLRAGLHVGDQVDVIGVGNSVVVRRLGQVACLEELLARFDPAVHHHELILDDIPPGS